MTTGPPGRRFGSPCRLARNSGTSRSSRRFPGRISNACADSSHDSFTKVGSRPTIADDGCKQNPASQDLTDDQATGEDAGNRAMAVKSEDLRWRHAATHYAICASRSLRESSSVSAADFSVSQAASQSLTLLGPNTNFSM